MVMEEVNADNVYGIFAAPTCTMFSLARTTAKTPRDFESAIKLVGKCLEIIWFCRASNESQLKKKRRRITVHFTDNGGK